MKITDSILYVGVNDHDIDLFEGQYTVPNGMAYNSYIVKGEKTAVMDSVDINFYSQWMANIKEALKILQSEKYLITKACDVIEQEIPNDEYVKKFVQFIRESKRGITLRKAENTVC